MISLKEINFFSKNISIDESVVAREYLQLLFLSEIYKESFAKSVFFKGGTAIRLVYGGTRFSEDLDFTVDLDVEDFSKKMQLFFSRFSKLYSCSFTERKTIAGKTYLMTNEIPGFKTPLYIKLDFSFREEVLDQKAIVLDTAYPIVIGRYIYALSKNEIVAEKVRAVMTRKKARDLYDLWYLLQSGATLNLELIKKKIEFYNVEYLSSDIIKRLDIFDKKDFIVDLRPFIPIDKRDELPDLFNFIKAYLITKFTE